MKERQPYCLMLIVDSHGKNQCTAPRVEGASLCMRHLAEAVRDYKELVLGYVAS